ncbi:glycosyltransferase family 61 protein [Aeromonas veronii]
MNDYISIPWVNAKEIGALSEPADMHLEYGFKVIRGATSNLSNFQAFSEIEDCLYSSPSKSQAIYLQDSYVFGCGFLIKSQEYFIQQSRYLNPDIDARLKNSLKTAPVELDDKTFWICGCNASIKNYWHWHAQSLPAILQCIAFLQKLGISKYGVIVPKMTSWQRKSLEALAVDFIDVVEISIYQTVYVKKLIISELMYSTSPYDASIYRRDVRDRILSSARENASGISAEKIYISRKDTNKRPMLNEAELTSSLNKLGFKEFVMSELSYFDQVLVFNSAEYIVCPHGAGTTNALFCDKQSKILELHQKSYPNAGPASLLKTNGATYHIDIFEDDGLGQLTNGWYVDVDLCLDSVQRMVSIK